MITIQWRHTTPGGKPGKFGHEELPSFEEAAELLARLAKSEVCWIFVQRQDVYFPGSSYKKEKKTK